MQQPHEEVRWKPSELMRNDTWTSMLESTFKLGDAVQIRVNRNEHDAVRADHLYQLLQHRLTTHIRKRVSDQTRHNHWCLQFAHHNLPQSSTSVRPSCNGWEHQKKHRYREMTRVC
jgi:hypothetical protein